MRKNDLLTNSNYQKLIIGGDKKNNEPSHITNYIYVLVTTKS